MTGPTLIFRTRTNQILFEDPYWENDMSHGRFKRPDMLGIPRPMKKVDKLGCTVRRIEEARQDAGWHHQGSQTITGWVKAGRGNMQTLLMGQFLDYRGEPS
jgi:hypothetical protein